MELNLDEEVWDASRFMKYRNGFLYHGSLEHKEDNVNYHGRLSVADFSGLPHVHLSWIPAPQERLIFQTQSARGLEKMPFKAFF